ncbi:SSURE domain-containing protein [Streptococcus gordonii]|uniref:SSURE domain-containing protein n=1 Tax=Streptococcus gordonii TaxID=1302 RepID=UPI00073B7CF5|nr:fibronectin-binding SSURE repeat-containing protein [Streptococcus gordonii]KTF20797.1 YSIRK signal domain/LPXTG anchor domain surface protein [Streptococcus gordonii]KXC03906.1 YSIRK signal domain/LPXTG anchor domain surface protein [Streptococcus gordonii]MBZ2151033.1 fibronectin-binding SSURE repeat-containing protein [Streptococcus gordonii]QWZ58365.1 fibronectin-binding SSURE repeat-containing protein [Streptococcus gordonii]SQF29028.1 cell wall surface anchor family protein [Streptoco
MKFNTNQKYTRWSIRRLSVGVASVVVASGFFLLVGQPNTVHADDLTSTPTKVLQEDSSLLEKNKLPETALKEEMNSALTANQSTPKEEVDETISLDKSSLAPKGEVVKPKEEQTMAEVSNQKEEAKPEATLVEVSNQDREATTSQSVTTPDEVRKGVEENTKDSVDVPASYLEKANVPGPFLAGVNQVIPYEAFGGDGMLTRLLLKSSDKAPWSDNGSANNPALLPLEGLAKGQYFYEVDLNGNTTGKDGQALLDQLRANGTRSYQATVKVYGAKDGKPDLTNLIATRQVTIQLRGKGMATIPSQEGQMNMKPSTTPSQEGQMNKKPSATDSMSTAEGTKEVDHRMTDVKGEHPTSKPMADTMKKNDKATLPTTGEAQTATATIGFLGLALAGILSLLGLKEKQKD